MHLVNNLTYYPLIFPVFRILVTVLLNIIASLAVCQIPCGAHHHIAHRLHVITTAGKA
jgi:hypothetical protein